MAWGVGNGDKGFDLGPVEFGFQGTARRRYQVGIRSWGCLGAQALGATEHPADAWGVWERTGSLVRTGRDRMCGGCRPRLGPVCLSVCGLRVCACVPGPGLGGPISGESLQVSWELACFCLWFDPGGGGGGCQA